MAQNNWLDEGSTPVPQPTSAAADTSWLDEQSDVVQDNALVRGFKKSSQSIGIAKGLLTGDSADTARKVAEAADYARKNPGMQEGKEMGAAWDRGDGITGGIKEVAGEFAKDWREAPGVIKGLRATGRNLRALGERVVEQVPNMAAPVTGMVGGALAGSAAAGPVGTVLGGWAGASLGNAAVEGGSMVQEALQKDKIDPTDQAAVSAYLDKNGDRILGQAGVKGAIIGAVDTLTAGLGGRLLNAPARAAADRALAGMGVNMADKAAVKAAKSSAEFKNRIASDAAYQATQQGANKIARNAGAAALEPAGEFAGEFVGQGVATGEWDAKNAALEAFSSIGQSGAMFAGQKAYQALTRPAGAADAQDKADAIIPPWTTEAGAADPNAPQTPPTAPPEAPDLTTAPGAGVAKDGLDFTREVDTSGLSLQDPAEIERAKAATVDYQPADTTPQWDTQLGATGPRQGLDMPAPEIDTTGLGLDPIRQMVKQAADAGGALSSAALTAIDVGATPVQFVSATGRDLQERATGPGVANESNVIDVQGRVIEDPAIGTPRRLTDQQDGMAARALGGDIAAHPPANRGSVPALPAPTNLRDAIARIRAQKQEAANAQATAPQAAPASAPVPTAGTGAVEAAGLTENKVGRKDSAQIAQPESVVGGVQHRAAPSAITPTTTQGNADGPQASQAQQAATQPAQAGAATAAEPAASATGATTTAGASTVRALSNGTPPQNNGAQAAPAAGANAAGGSGVQAAGLNNGATTQNLGAQATAPEQQGDAVPQLGADGRIFGMTPERLGSRQGGGMDSGGRWYDPEAKAKRDQEEAEDRRKLVERQKAENDQRREEATRDPRIKALADAGLPLPQILTAAKELREGDDSLVLDLARISGIELPQVETKAPEADKKPGAQGAAPAESAEQRTQRVAQAGEAWTRMPAAQREALAGIAAGLNPIQRKRVPSAAWADLNRTIQSNLADAMGGREEYGGNQAGTSVDAAPVAINSEADQIAEAVSKADRLDLKGAERAQWVKDSLAGAWGMTADEVGDMPEVAAGLRKKPSKEDATAATVRRVEQVVRQAEQAVALDQQAQKATENVAKEAQPFENRFVVKDDITGSRVEWQSLNPAGGWKVQTTFDNIEAATAAVASRGIDPAGVSVWDSAWNASAKRFTPAKKREADRQDAEMQASAATAAPQAEAAPEPAAEQELNRPEAPANQAPEAIKKVAEQAAPKPDSTVTTMRSLAQQFRDRHAVTKKDTDRTFAGVLDQFAQDVEQGKRTTQSVQQAIERYQELAAEPFQATQTAPATHADPGQAPEVATPAVVAQSVQKAARNEDTKPSEMRKWLVGKIDDAIAVAPEAAVDFLSFDVPGDGTFKVQNSQARLQEFRKKVMTSPGFKDGGQKQNTKPLEQVDSAINGSGSTVEAIRNFLADGDVQSAIEFAKLKGVEFTPVEPRASMTANGKFKRMPASVKSSVPSVAEGLTQVEAEQINQYLTAERPDAEAVAQPITRADVTAARQQAAAIITERIDAMTAGEVNTIARRFLPTMGVKPTVSKERNKAAMTDSAINLEAAAAEVGATLPADVRRVLQADMEGRVTGQDGPMFSRAPAAFSFAGQQAVTADQHALTTAQQRLDAGEDAEAVRQDTGWFKGTDGKWRFEIDDSRAFLKGTGTFGDVVMARMAALEQGGLRNAGDPVRLGDVLRHESLFAAYPALRDIEVQFTRRGDTAKGRLATDDAGVQAIHVRYELDDKEALSVLLHEIQHGIQTIEGFATGGTPQSVASILEKERFETMANKDDALTAEFDALKRQYAGVPESEIPQEVANRVRQLRSEINAIRNTGWREASNPFARRQPTPEELFAGYTRLAGEVEARNTQARQKLTAEQRRATSPGQTADVADADVIVVFNGKEMANAPMPANAAPDAATTAQPLRTPAATIRAAITKAYGKLLGQLESKGLVTLTQTEDEAIEAAAQARAAKTGQSVEQARSTLRASVKNSVADQTQTEAFKRWFGDSKAVDANGRPLVVYHGTRRPFNEFSPSRPRGAPGNPEGVYFTADKGVAEEYAQDADGAWDEKSRIVSAYIKIENDADGKIIDSAYRGREYVVFKPENIKSATGNRGTFDPADPDIRRSADGAIQGFFDPQTGQSFLIADNLTAEAAPGVLMHEVGIHMAADGSMKALFNRAAMMLKLQRGNPFMKAVQDRMDAAGETSGEEAAAYIAEAYENDRANAPASVQRWLADLLAAVKAWMFKKGIMGADRLTVADIAAVARANAKTLARGQQGVVVKRAAASFSRVSSEAPVDFSSDPRFHELFYGEPTQQQVAEFQRWLDANPETIVRLYHGTAAVNPVDAKGLLKTTASRRNSMQSTSGYVYLSVYPGMADSFARMAALNRGAGPQGKKHARYAVDMRVAELLPDTDQLRNQRMFADRKVGNTLAESLAYGHAARVKGNVASERISLDGPMFSRSESGDQTQTDAFKRWFGDSKAVDADGKPLRVFHGTGGDFSVFSRDRAGATTGAANAGMGFFFTDNAEVAGNYARMSREPQSIMPVYLSLQNPLRMEAKNMMEADRLLQSGLKENNDGAIITVAMRDGGTQTVYMARESSQVKSATGNNGNFDPANPDIRFSRATSPTASTAASPAWDAPVQTGFDDVIYKLQDKNIDLKRVVEAITKSVGQVSDSINAYLKEELFHKRAAKRVEDFGARELKPLMNQMRLAGLSMEDVEEYLHARHAKEANAVIAQRNPGNAGLQDGGSGMTNAAADNYFAKLDPAQRRKLESVAAKVDAIIADTRKLYVDYGLEDQAVVDGWANMYQHYIPLMREDKEGGMGIGQGFSVKGKETKGRTGSTRKVVDILANIAAQRERLIVRGEKNRVTQALVGLAQANPNPEFWEVRSQAPTERVFDPKSGVVVERPDPLFKSRDNVVVAKVKDAKGNVTEQMVVFNEDNPRAVRMAAAMKNLDAGNLEGLLGMSAKITRYFSAINTQYNPVFGVVNLVRDVQGAMVNLAATPLAGQQGKIARDTVSALAGIYSDIRKTRKGGQASSKWAQLWEQMQDDGGTTGYRELFTTSADRASNLKSILNPQGWMDSKWGKVFTADGKLRVPMSMAQKGASEIFGWLSDYNEAMENGVRLAAYKAALDMGMSREQAASLAKNLTVNFNRKGQVGMQAGAVYAFFNAAMQGTARIGQTLFDMDGGDISTLRLSKTGKAVVYGGVTLGVMQALALAGAGFDEEDPPEFVRERSLIIPTGWTGIGPEKGYFSIPMPLGLHVIPGIGRHATEFALSGFDKPAKRALSVIGMFADAFNPIGNAGLSMQTLAPTALDPLVALTENKDWTGKPIARVSFNKAMPGHTQWKDTATWYSKMAAEAINWVSGGNEYVAGALSPTPDQIDYLIAQVGGGVAREASKVFQAASTTVNGEELPTYKIPLLGRFAGNAASQASQGSAFYANLNRLNELETEIKGLRKDGRFDEAAKLVRENPQATMIAMANRAERDVQKLRREKRELIAKDASREEVRAKEEQITAVMTRLNEAAERRKALATQ